jgi:hypothetical protein
MSSTMPDSGMVGMQNGADAVCNSIRIFVSPDSDHIPAHGSETSVGIRVPRAVRLYLLSPKFGITLGPRGVLWTPVPKAAVHENSDAGTGKYDVGNATRLRQQRNVQAIPQAPCVQSFP